MRKLVGFLCGLLLLGLVGGAAASAQVKIGVVDLGRVIDESEAGIQANVYLNQFIAELQADLDALETHINTLERELQQAGDDLAEGDRTAKETQIDQLINEYVNRFNTYEAHIQELSQSLQQSLLAEIFVVLEHFIEQNGYDIVLDANAILFYRVGVDITQDIVRTYNELRSQGAIQLVAPIPSEANE